MDEVTSVRAVGRNVIVVGGGLAGLATAIYLARAGRTVTLFEKRRFLGGRAVTQLRHGFRFNLGAHTFYRGGAAAAVCRELGIPVRGGAAKLRGVAWYGGERYRLPAPWLSLFTSGLLQTRGKSELFAMLFRIRKIDARETGSLTLAQWLETNVHDPRARQVLAALIRSVTFSDHADTESAGYSLVQLRNAMRGAVYIDEGWQKIVDALHSAAISSGVNFVTSSRVLRLITDERVRGVELGGLELDADRSDTQSLAFPMPAPEQAEGARVPADHVVLAVDPATAYELAGETGSTWTSAHPVTASCLDVALRSLPEPRNTFVLGIDQPVMLAAHSTYAQLTPKGGALVHVVRHRRESAASDQQIDGERLHRNPHLAADEALLEEVLDRAQPGWRELLVHRRFLPSMTVTNSLVTPGRPRPMTVTSLRGLYIAGDWVGNEGLLVDAALASARAAAAAVLAEK